MTVDSDAAAIEALHQSVRYWQGDATYFRRKVRDLERVVADQRRYIESLEEQLLPHLKAGEPVGEQEAML